MRRLKARPAMFDARIRHLPLAVLAASLVSLAVAAAPADAETVHVFSGTIAGNPLAGTAMNTPKSVAADGSSGPESGTVYVADSNNNRIMKFSPSGQFLMMWGRSVNEGSGEPDVCTNAGAPTDICKTGSNTQGPGSTVGGFRFTQPIAVDSSSGPSAGDIYVLGPTGSALTIQKFNPSGHLVTSFGTGSPFPGAIPVAGNPNSMVIDLAGHVYTFGEGNIVREYDEAGVLVSTSAPSPRPSYVQFGLAVDGAGDFFQMNQEGEYNTRTIQRFDGAGTNLGQIDKPPVNNWGLTFDQSSNELLSSFGEYPNGSGVHVYRFNGSGEVIQPDGSVCVPALAEGCAPTEVLGKEQISAEAQATGIGVNPSSHTIYLADKPAGNVKVFERLNLAKFTTPAPTDVTRTSVTFSSHVDPDGAGNVESCEIEYGLTKEYSDTVTCTPDSFSSPTDVDAALPTDTLTAGTLYHYRLVVGNPEGDRPSPDLTFSTLPAVGGVTTGAASEVKQLTANLAGSFTGDGVATEYFFEYGPTTQYGQKTPAVDQGSAAGPQSISQTATQLLPYTQYHFRLVAQNSYGTTYGADQEFHTIEPNLPEALSTYTTFVDEDSAVVNAAVDTGEGPTSYRFEYGTDTSYGSRALVGGPIDPEGSDQVATSELEELSSGTTYHYRVRLTNFTGSSVGPDRTFTTPSNPVIASASATGVGLDSATLNALISPSLAATTYHFEYGPTQQYGFRTTDVALGSGAGFQAAAATVAGLAPGTTYHFRVVAGNEVGSSVSTDQTFSTAPPPAPPAKPQPKKCKKGQVRKQGKCKKKKPKHRKNKKGGKRG